MLTLDQNRVMKQDIHSTERLQKTKNEGVVNAPSKSISELI